MLDVLNQANIIMKENGKDFESFVQGALMLRLALRSDDTRVKINLSSLLPGNIYKGTLEETAAFIPLKKRQYFFHGILSKEELKLFLLCPIHNLFPVGWATLTSARVSVWHRSLRWRSGSCRILHSKFSKDSTWNAIW